MPKFNYISDIDVVCTNKPALLFDPEDVFHIYQNELDIRDIGLNYHAIKEEIFDWFVNSLYHCGFGCVDRFGDQILAII